MTTPRGHGLEEGIRTAEPWDALAAKWTLVGSPLRPCPEDLRRLKETWVQSLPGGVAAGPIEVLMLGVTPELALFPWAEKFRLQAVDCSKEMIESVWPGNGPDRQVVLGHWEQMPFADGSFDLIVSDNPLTMLPETAGVTAVAGELRRLLKSGGRVAMRQFVPARGRETEPSLLAAAEAGEMHNFHGLKLRLLVTVAAQNSGWGLRVGEAWERFQRLFPDREALARRLGCDLATIATIDGYRGRDGRYAFRSLAEVARLCEGFHLEEGPAGHYPFAEYCPVFSLTPLR